MSESEQPEGESWWSSWLSTAREKSISALSATKRDLAEFVTVISTDTKAAVSDASAKAKQIMKQDETEEETKGGTRRKPTSTITTATLEPPAAPYDRCKAQIFTLQNSPNTYLTDPKDGKAFAEWKDAFGVQAHQPEISNLLVTCSRIRTLHAQLIPAQVSYESFWQRYFYKVQLHEQEEERRIKLMARANPRQETLQWDEDVEEDEAMTIISKTSSDHHRSESSDSFVCVSEDTLNEARERQQVITEFDPLDPDGWGLVMPEAEAVGEGGEEEEVKKEEEKEEEKEEVEEEEDDTVDSEVDGGSSNSDWENWDD